MQDIPNSKIKQLPKIEGTITPNKGVEILYRNTNTSTFSRLFEGDVEVCYEYYDFDGYHFYPEVEIRLKDANRTLLAKLPLVGVRLIRFIY